MQRFFPLSYRVCMSCAEESHSSNSLGESTVKASYLSFISAFNLLNSAVKLVAILFSIISLMLIALLNLIMVCIHSSRCLAALVFLLKFSSILSRPFEQVLTCNYILSSLTMASYETASLCPYFLILVTYVCSTHLKLFLVLRYSSVLWPENVSLFSCGMITVSMSGTPLCVSSALQRWLFLG